MWSFVLNLISTSVEAAFGWFQQILSSAPGSWDTIFTIFVVFAVCRFLLTPLLGVAFSGLGSDKVKKTRGAENE